MNKYFKVVLGILGVLLVVGVLFSDSTPVQLGGYAPRISSDQVVHSSSSLGLLGLVLFTNASNTGDWFRIVNGSPNRVFCGTGTNTTSIMAAGQLLSPTSSSTGSTAWEMYGVAGPVSCVSDTAGSLITWSFTSYTSR